MSNYEVMTYDEFWKRNPAPDTVFFELGSPCQIVAKEIDVRTQEPDDVRMVSMNSDLGNEFRDYIAVVRWGKWEGYEKYLDMHDEAEKLMNAEAAEEGREDWKHDDCKVHRPQ